ncbi:MAG TPA: hypothetical protein VN756_04270 [Solirubrobacterales bacterium]|nr:hypothetical protein [Solirubrobacterales bacterium]
MAPPGALIDIQAGYVLALITLIVLPVAAIAFARAGPLWQSLGKGPFAIEQELPPSIRPGQPDPPVDRGLQEAEARQMLEAKSYRRQQRGESPLDVEAEVTRLLDSPGAARPEIDEKLRAEVRQLVIARNERRMRRGEEPLDVESEIDRQLVDL